MRLRQDDTEMSRSLPPRIRGPMHPLQRNSLCCSLIGI